MDVTGVVERFRMAAFGMEDWQDALGALAEALDARVIHLVGVNRDRAILFNWIHGVTPDMLDEFMRQGGMDPTVNPRSGIAIDGPMLRTVFDEMLLTQRDRDALPIYDNLFRRAGADYAAMNRLNIPNAHAGLSALRSRSFHQSGDREARLLDAIAPIVSEIAAQAMVLGVAQDRTMVRTADLLENAVLLLDGDRRVVQMSPAFEQWLKRDGPLTIRGGRVHARDAKCDSVLSDAIAKVLDRSQALQPGRRVVLRMPDDHDQGDGGQLVVAVRAVPLRPSGPLARARVMLSTSFAATPAADLFADLFGLTRAEAQIAVLMAQGWDIAAIARQRGCSATTVRTQIKALFQKSGTNRQGALVARLRAVC